MTLRKRAGWVTRAVLVGLAASGCGQVAGSDSGEAQAGQGGSAGQAGAPGKTPGGAGGDTGGDSGGDSGGAAVGRPAWVDASAPWSTSLPFAKSGTRLQALGYVGQGVEQFRAMHDALLGFDCVFALDATRTGLRCVPPAESALIYLDAQCTQPAVWEWGGVRQGDWLSEKPAQPAVECPGEAKPHREVFEVAERVYEESYMSEASPVFEHRGGECVVAFPPAKGWPAVNRLIAHPEGELVGAKRVNVDVADNLHVSRIVADDGAQLTVGTTSLRQLPCELQADGECVPAKIAVSGLVDFFTALDADCTRPAFNAIHPSACGAPEFGVEGSTAEAFRVHRLVAAPALFYRIPAIDIDVPYDPQAFTCQRAPGGETTGYAPGMDLTGTFPTAHRARRGTGALHVDWFVSTLPGELGVVPLAPIQGSPQFLDASGEPCTITHVADDSLRCAPASHEAKDADFWKDAACTMRLYRASEYETNTAKLYVNEFRVDASGLTGVYSLAAYHGPAYSLRSGVCSQDIPDLPVFTQDRRTDVSALPRVFEKPM